ncbi:MAG: Crp/Fnr family transcriptional regulator [Silicimonas sp.]|nr:Crp/Fnr family transcriptional regulator [Silicimonas sp.]
MTPHHQEESRCESCPIRERAVCATCDSDELQQLEAIKYYRTYEARQPIMWRGDRMEFVASVVSGTATVEHLTEDGRKQTLGLLLPSDFIGRPGRDTALYDVAAVTEVTLCCFRRKQFEELVQTTPHVSQRLLEMALDELDAVRDWMFLLGRKTAREKIASFLMMYYRRTVTPEQQFGAATVDLSLTREAMADYLGLTLETVSRQFSKLKSDGVIKLEGKRKVIIPDVHALAREAGDDSIIA